MSSKEKENFISFITAFSVSVPYFIYIFDSYSKQSFSTAEELKFWATAILLLIPIRIIVQIVVHIIVEIFSEVTKTKQVNLTDERDNHIETKALRNSYFTFILGFAASLLAVVINPSISTMFTVLFFAGFAAELIGIFSKICYYKKGF